MGLQEEIDDKRRDIKPDSYSMSIGEWINLYEEREIDIHPEFQRFFRWSTYQKTSLIESILLGIPIPPIFVSQKENGVWDVVDGLQRLSTIYEFIGKLRDENGNLLPPLVLERTKYLPSLEGKKWDDPNDESNSLTSPQRLSIKRSKIDVTILLKDSSPLAKFDLFQRLNTGGSIAKPQEVRSCILVMYNPDMFRWMQSLSKYPAFQSCLSLSDRSIDEQYDMELLLRFLVFRSISESNLKGIGDISVFLTDKMVAMAQQESYDFDQEEEAFKVTFELLEEKMGGDCFRKYDKKKDRFMGGFLVSAFEVIALGIGYNYEELKHSEIDIKGKIQYIWTKTNYSSWSGGGTDAKRRVPKLIPLGRKIFRP